MTTNSTKSVLPSPEGIVTAVAAKSRLRRKSLQVMTAMEGRRPPNRNDLAPPLAFVYRKAGTLKKATRRLHKADAIQQTDLKNSFGQFGICGTALITPDGEIIDGHLFVDTSVAMGIVDIPCLVVGHLSKADIRRLRIALNRIQEKGEWDLVALEAEIKELSLEFGENLFIPGIEPPVLDGFLLEELDASQAETEKLEVQAGKVITAPNDVWKLGRHIIACADARNLTFALALLEAHFGATKVRLNFSDLPYNVRIQGHVTGGEHREFIMASGELSEPDFHAFLVASLKTILETLAEGGLAMLFMDWRGLKSLLNAATEAGFSLLNIVVWAKTNAGMGSHYRSQHEFIVIFKKGSASHINNVELGRHGR